ncbi:hypothetical protein ACRAVF_24525 [Bradyrhizobium oligotrophicum S58]
MERWQFIRWGIAASVLAHLLIAGGVVVSTTVRPYEIARTDEVAVDIVDADEPEKTPEPVPTPSPSPELTLPQPAPSLSPAAAAPPPAPEPAQPPVQEAKEMPKPPQPQPSPTPPSKAVKSAAKAEAKSAARPPPPVPAPAPSYVPPEPDLTVKYGVMLGLPEPLSPLPPASGPDDAKDSGPAATASLAPNLETALRQRVRSCARLSASMSPSDRVMVRLRFAMTPDGRLATEPEVRR